MKNFHGVFGVFLLVSPVLSFYMHDASSKVGYVSVQNSGRSSERHGFRGMQRRHFSGSSRHQKNENIVDSHFKVKKTPPYLAYNEVENRRGEVQQMHWNTEAPTHQQPKHDKEIVEETPRQSDSSHASDSRGRSVDKQETQQPFTMQRSRPINADYHVQMPQRNQNIPSHNYQDHQNRYEKPNFVEMNVHKKQISTDPQKLVRLNNNQQITSISVHRPEEIYQKIPTSVVVDKTLQKVTAHNDRRSQVMSRVLDEMTHTISDRRQKGENRKRNIEYNDNYDMDKTNRNSISDTMRKYIISKDKTINVERKSMKEFSRIGSHEDSIEPEDNPYAIFYRMHPDTLDEQEGFISMGSMEENTNMFTNKKKRLSIGYENQVDLKKAKKKSKSSNAVKLHKKVKNFSNFRSL